MTQSTQRPIDLDHLNIYTGGDHTLNREILGLFDGQCHEIVEKLADLAKRNKADDSAKNWHDAVHSLKGAARGVGAFKLGDIAAEAEKMKLSNQMEVLEMVERLKLNAAIVHQFIDEVIGKSG